jgi:hypothetical protein
MGEALQLRAASGFLISGYGNVRIQQSEITMLGGKLITRDEQASFASGFLFLGGGEEGIAIRGKESTLYVDFCIAHVLGP